MNTEQLFPRLRNEIIDILYKGLPQDTLEQNRWEERLRKEIQGLDRRAWTIEYLMTGNCDQDYVSLQQELDAITIERKRLQETLSSLLDN
jgi:hypothetical protein